MHIYKAKNNYKLDLFLLKDVDDPLLLCDFYFWHKNYGRGVSVVIGSRWFGSIQISMGRVKNAIS